MTASIASIPRRSIAQPTREGLRLAAIDIGSNSVHMVVAQVDADGGVTTLWRMTEMVGLGRISFPSRRLTKDAMDRALMALGRFKQAAQQRQAEKVIAVATSAIREAENGGDFIERAKRELGLYVRVVSARDEARLIYLAVRHSCNLKDQPHLIVDIGGGSVEFIVGDERKAAMLESRKLGAARMSAKYVHSDPISDDDKKALLRSRTTSRSR
jgi:exopolyphosphatase/guanosine-5'-triphosphate,3'-diphosphate pyrophosphatase